MDAVILVLLLAAFVCFSLAAGNIGSRINLVALGLTFWVLTQLIPAVAAL